MRIAVALFADAEELDWAGTWEVLAFWSRMCPEDGVRRRSAGTGDVCERAAGAARHGVGRAWMLDGCPATTHWADTAELASHGQNIEVRGDDRFVDAGEVITAAGVSAGIDLALHLVARLHSSERARQVRRGIQYDPTLPV